MAYRANPSIADRMKVLEFQSSLLRKQDPPAGDGMGQTAAMPAPVSPPAAPPSSAPETMGAPTPDEMEALATSEKVYGSSKEALADWEQRLTEIATDITAHIGTIGQTRYTEDLDGDSVLGHGESLMALRGRVEDTRNMCEIIRLKDAGMVNHIPGMGGMGMPGMDALQNMPAPGPAGMPPGAMANAGPMGGGM